DNSISLVRKIDSKIYWSVYQNGNIRSKNADGSGSATTLAVGQCPNDMVSDGAYLYWANCDGSIRKVNLVGTPGWSFVSRPVPVTAGEPEKLTLDTSGGLIYF